MSTNQKPVVRALFDAILTPLIDALDREVERVDARDWTWSGYSGGLDAIRPLVDYLDPEFQPPASLYVATSEVLAALVERHDHNVDALALACSTLGHALETDPAFAALRKRALDDLEEGVDFGPVMSTHVEESAPAIDVSCLVEYTLNRRGVLPEYFMLSRLWYERSEAFIDAMSGPSLRAENNAVIDAGDELKRSTLVLTDMFRGIREELSRQYDVPIMRPI